MQLWTINMPDMLPYDTASASYFKGDDLGRHQLNAEDGDFYWNKLFFAEGGHYFFQYRITDGGYQAYELYVRNGGYKRYRQEGVSGGPGG